MDMNSELCTNQNLIAPVLAEITPVNMSTDLSKESIGVSGKEKTANSSITKEKLKDAKLYCEWNMCCVFLSQIEMKKFLLHIAGHIVATNGPPSNEGFHCLWRNCGYVCQTVSERDRHVYFHAFHAKIKGIGEVVMKLFNLQCSIDDQTKNIIPEIPEPFDCLWGNCGISFISAQEFYWHVEAHPNSTYHEKSKRGSMNTGNKKFSCSWKGCKTVTKTSYRLIDHVRSHSQEKIVACPNCGSIYASFPKFRDHCFRHVSEEYLKFECSHCKCKFATERLLKEHIRSHVNHFKCPHCDMTCPTKFAMENHIIYRHTNNKPFKCSECDKRFKLQQDVLRHLPSHSTEASFACPFPDCQFSSRSASCYHLHIKKKHTDADAPKNPYMCHICEKKFSKGAKLTSHLKKTHDFHWPSGHVRFRYSKDDDGFYKLQTTRIESIELSQDVISEDAETNPDDPDALDPKTSVSTFKIPEKQMIELETTPRKLERNENCYYMCHVCQQKFSKGPRLRDHLEKSHDYQWPLTNTTFRYRKGIDGFYKLCIVRFDSFKLNPDSLNDSFCITGLLTEDSDNTENVNSKEAAFKCQICQWKFIKGQSLFNHFEKNHNFKWPPTYFKYRFQDCNGCHVLHALHFGSEPSQENLNDDFLCYNDSSDPKEPIPITVSLSRLSNKKENDLKHSETAEKHFMCHLCLKKFTKGQMIIHHLKKIHKFCTLASDNKFSKDTDGYFKLVPSLNNSIQAAIEMEESIQFSDCHASILPLTPDVIISPSGSQSLNTDTEQLMKCSGTAKFMCHICNMKFSEDSRLSYHLKKDHNFCILSSHTQFCKDNDGYYKLIVSETQTLDTTDDHATRLPMTPDVSILGMPSSVSSVKEQRKALENMYSCHICQKKFGYGARLIDHLKNFHKYHCSISPNKFSKDEHGYWELKLNYLSSESKLAEYIDYNESNIDDLAGQLPMTPDVPFSVPGLITIGTNMQERLEVSKKLFRCHLCTNKFDDGLRLTDHLRNYHGLLWSDQTVFRYNKDAEGYFKLQLDTNYTGFRNILKKVEDYCDESQIEMQLPKTPEAIFTINGLITDETNMLADEVMQSQPFKKRKKEENQVLRFSDL